VLSHLGSSATFYCAWAAAVGVVASLFSQAPLLRDGLFFVPVAGGLCPLAWPGGAGSDLPRCRCTWAMAPGDFFFIRGLLASLVRPSSEGPLPTAGAIRGALSSLFGGGVYSELTPSSDCPDLVLGSSWGT
jgi:hypothetical protein